MNYSFPRIYYEITMNYCSTLCSLGHLVSYILFTIDLKKKLYYQKNLISLTSTKGFNLGYLSFHISGSLAPPRASQYYEALSRASPCGGPWQGLLVEGKGSRALAPACCPSLPASHHKMAKQGFRCRSARQRAGRPKLSRHTANLAFQDWPGKVNMMTIFAFG